MPQNNNYKKPNYATAISHLAPQTRLWPEFWEKKQPIRFWMQSASRFRNFSSLLN